MLSFKEFTRQQINEIGDQPYPVNVVKKSTRRYLSLSRMSDKRQLDISFYCHDPGEWSLVFKVDGRMDITGGGDAYRILSSVIVAIEQFIKICDQPISEIVLVAYYQSEGSFNQKTSRRDGIMHPDYQKTSRADLYRAMLKKYARRGKFEFSEKTDGERSIFTLSRKESTNA